MLYSAFIDILLPGILGIHQYITTWHLSIYYLAFINLFSNVKSPPLQAIPDRGGREDMGVFGAGAVPTNKIQ